MVSACVSPVVGGCIVLTGPHLHVALVAGDIMEAQAMGLRDFASSIQRDLKVTFQVRLYDELDHRPCQPSSDSRKRPEATTMEEQGHESCCANDEHRQELEECSHQGGISVMHGDHPAVIVGNEIHCECKQTEETSCRKRTCHKQVLNAPEFPLKVLELSTSA